MNHDAAYLARQIGKTENWVKRNANRMPHSRAGRTYFWTDQDVADVLAWCRVRPGMSEPDDGATSARHDDGALRPIPPGQRARTYRPGH